MPSFLKELSLVMDLVIDIVNEILSQKLQFIEILNEMDSEHSGFYNACYGIPEIIC